MSHLSLRLILHTDQSSGSRSQEFSPSRRPFLRIRLGRELMVYDHLTVVPCLAPVSIDAHLEVAVRAPIHWHQRPHGNSPGWTPSRHFCLGTHPFSRLNSTTTFHICIDLHRFYPSCFDYPP